nr:MAG TPA: hypothetical protein [Caudoviricetes sp.]
MTISKICVIILHAKQITKNLIKELKRSFKL